ncbi:hypothetical protein [Candidatus Magnetominusculus dajiuhuensis]|uniref:hypothetical protein n=1 Tax=Candidatus Magnetominusculus dajiuhuensis TaxID=3137712 RepID=UPI003B43AAF8
MRKLTRVKLAHSLSTVLLSMALLVAMLIAMSGIPAYAEEEKAAPVAKEEAAPAKEEPIPLAGTAGPDNASVSVVFSAFNRYIYRGYELSTRSMVFQPSVTFSWMGFAANAWSNIDTREQATQSFVPDRPGQASYNEVDIKLSYTRSWGGVSLTGGYIYYGLQYAKKTQEVFLAAALDVITKPVLTVYRDVAGYPGIYYNLAFSHSAPLSMIMKDMTLDLGASFGYEQGTSPYWSTYEAASTSGGLDAYTGKKYSAFHDGMLMVGVTIPIVNNLTVQPVAMYTFPLSHDASRMVNGVSYNPNGALDQNFVYGLNLTYNF